MVYSSVGILARYVDMIREIYTWSDHTEMLAENDVEDIVGNSAYEYLTMPNPYKAESEERT